MNTIIVKGLGKSYKSYKNKIFKLISYFFPKEKRFFEIKTVLNKIDFEISSGESVGIIGVNGAGKSTLLKLITGTTSPTEGTIKVVGDISALLELGLGFHPDFTGRQNVFMSGQLMGLSKKEIELAMPDIEKFAEIGSAIDMAVKNYSSGMHVRLAFSIATYKRPDILIVDEALSVGDAYFQHKCFERIKSFRDQGSTLLFVSHDPGAIKNLCNRAILLYMGEIKFDGRPDDALDYYNSLISSSKFLTTGLNKPNAMVGVRSGSREIEIKKVMMFSYENEGYLHKIGDSVSIETQLKINIPVENLCVGVSIRDRLGNEIFGTNTGMLGLALDVLSKDQILKIRFLIPSLSIGVGSYSVSVAAHDITSHINGNYDWWDKAIMFEIVAPEEFKSVGVCYFPCYAKLY